MAGIRDRGLRTVASLGLFHHRLSSQRAMTLIVVLYFILSLSGKPSMRGLTGPCDAHKYRSAHPLHWGTKALPANRKKPIFLPLAPKAF